MIQNAEIAKLEKECNELEMNVAGLDDKLTEVKKVEKQRVEQETNSHKKRVT